MVSKLLRLFILLLALLLSVGTFADPQYRTIEYKHPVTGDVYDIKVEQPDTKTLSYWSPKNLTMDKVKELFQSTGQDAVRIGKESVKEFPLSAGTFYGASFLVKLRACLTDPSADPTCIDNFFIHQVRDPVAHVSFLSFLASHKTASEILNYIAVQRGWIRNDKQFFAIYKKVMSHSPGMNPLTILKDLETQFPQPSSAKYFRSTSGMASMAAAFVISGIVGDFAHDPHVQHCFITPTYDIVRRSEEIAKMGMTVDKACEIAWSTWVSSGKILDYAPSIVSAAISQAIVSKALPVLNKRITYILRGIRFLRVAGNFFPQSRALLMVENAYFFLELDGIINPLIKDPFEAYRKSNEIRLATIKLNQTLMKGLQFPNGCKKTLDKKFSPEVQKISLSSDLIEFLKENDPDCGELPETPLEQVKKFTEAQESWRGYWLSSAKESLANWQKEMLSLQSNVQDSQKFYEEVLNYIYKSRKGKFDPKAFREILTKYDIDHYDESYPSIYTRFRFKNRSDYFLTMMVCGPMPGEKLYSKIWGFPLYYLPPSLVTAEAQAACRVFPREGGHTKGSLAANNWDDWQGAKQTIGGRVYTDVFNMLLGNLRPEFRTDATALPTLWEKELKPQTLKIIEEKRKDFVKVHERLQKAMNRDDAYASDNSVFKNKPSGFIPYGFLNHLELEVASVLGMLGKLQGWKLPEAEDDYLKMIFAASRNSDKAGYLRPYVDKAGLGEVLDLQMARFDDPLLKNFVLQKVAVETLLKKVATLVQAEVEKKSGYELEMASALFERFEALLRALPDTQIYRITVTSPL